MRIARHAAAGAFLARARDWLLASEAENNLVLGVALRFSRDSVDGVSEHYWATAEADDRVLGCAFRTPPHPIVLTSMPLDAVAPLVDDLDDRYTTLPAVNGPRPVAERFATVWTARHGGTWTVRMGLVVHRLTTVRPLDTPPAGFLRAAREPEIPLIREWTAGFVEDTGIQESKDDFASRVVSAGRVFVWDDEGPRCMLASNRDSLNGACINAVYTPPRDRCRGYATAAVADLSRRLLESGKTFCCLYTDAANPTSNAIYRRIGYEPVREDVDIEFGG